MASCYAYVYVEGGLGHGLWMLVSMEKYAFSFRPAKYVLYIAEQSTMQLALTIILGLRGLRVLREIADNVQQRAPILLGIKDLRMVKILII